MKKCILLSFLFLTVLTNFLFAENIKPRIGILDFNAKNVSQVEAEAVGELFTSEMVTTGKFDIVDRQNIENLLTEMDFQLSGCTDSSCAVEVGQILSLEYMIYGSVIKLGEVFAINVQMINVETAQIEHTGSERFQSIEEAYDVIPRIAAVFGENFGTDNNAIVTESSTELSNRKNIGIATFFSGIAVAGLSAWGWIETDGYYRDEVIDAYEAYSTAGIEELSELKQTYLDTKRKKNTLLFLSLGGSVLGVTAITFGYLLLFTEIPFVRDNNDAEISFRITPSVEGISLLFSYQGVR